MKMRIKPTIVDVVEDDGMYLDKSTMTYYEKDALEPIVEPKGLNKAAKEYAEKYTESENGNGGDDWEDDIRIAFLACAEWMAAQGVIKEGVVIDNGEFIKFRDDTFIDLDPSQKLQPAFHLKNGENVVVQVLTENSN